MNEQNPQRTPIPVELDPSHAERIRVQTETFEAAGAAAIEAKRRSDESQAVQAEALKTAGADIEAVESTAFRKPDLHVVQPIIDQVPWKTDNHDK